MSSLIKESLAISGFVDIAVWRKRGVLSRSQLLGNFVVASRSCDAFNSARRSLTSLENRSPLYLVLVIVSATHKYCTAYCLTYSRSRFSGRAASTLCFDLGVMCTYPSLLPAVAVSASRIIDAVSIVSNREFDIPQQAPCVG